MLSGIWLNYLFRHTASREARAAVVHIRHKEASNLYTLKMSTIFFERNHMGTGGHTSREFIPNTYTSHEQKRVFEVIFCVPKLFDMVIVLCFLGHSFR